MEKCKYKVSCDVAWRGYCESCIWAKMMKLADSKWQQEKMIWGGFSENGLYSWTRDVSYSRRKGRKVINKIYPRKIGWEEWIGMK